MYCAPTDLCLYLNSQRTKNANRSTSLTYHISAVLHNPDCPRSVLMVPSPLNSSLINFLLFSAKDGRK
ncbi:unnamed protein product, partial [Hymenolepis diminuta]